MLTKPEQKPLSQEQIVAILKNKVLRMEKELALLHSKQKKTKKEVE